MRKVIPFLIMAMLIMALTVFGIASSSSTALADCNGGSVRHDNRCDNNGDRDHRLTPVPVTNAVPFVSLQANCQVAVASVVYPNGAVVPNGTPVVFTTSLGDVVMSTFNGVAQDLLPVGYNGYVSAQVNGLNTYNGVNGLYYTNVTGLNLGLASAPAVTYVTCGGVSVPAVQTYLPPVVQPTAVPQVIQAQPQVITLQPTINVIRPPNTGDGGLLNKPATGKSVNLTYLGIAGLLMLTGLMTVRWYARRE